jgi:toxin YoeB
MPEGYWKRSCARTAVPEKRWNLMTSRKSQAATAFLLIVDPNFIEDLQYWIETKAKVATKVLKLVDCVRRDPFLGEGKPEPLKFLGPGVWSRRITEEHRIVYRVEKDRIHFLQCRYHYGK